MSNRIAEVAVPRDIFKTFDYRIPEALQDEIAVGMRARVPFRDEELSGFVVALKAESSFAGRLSPVKSLLDAEPVIDEAGFQLARWVCERYLCPLGLVLSAMAPALLRKRASRTRSHVRLKTGLDETLRWIERLSQSAPQQASILKALLADRREPLIRDLISELAISEAPIKSLVQKGVLAVTRRPLEHRVSSPFHEESFRLTLNAEQHQALDAIQTALVQTPRAFLLHGVNASGKTEIYLRSVQQTLALKKQAIVTVPEISLTPQLIARFRSRFGERLAVYHSQLTAAQRSREWERIHDGDVDVVIGVRSALFAPLSDPGLIIMDEEHEPTYKQDDPAPRYHAREVALERARLAQAVVVLGSATPSLESYWRAQRGSFQLLELKERVIGSSEPDVKIIDQGGEDELLSPRLAQAISTRLRQQEQVLLLLNLRGFSRCVICKDCRATQRCPRCDIALVYHLREQRVCCHFCGHDFPVGRCRGCHSANLKFIGAGTEQAELALREAFPSAAIARMDSDVVKRGEHGALLESFRKGEIEILVGTQMIGLGLDFPNLTLVGILSADTLLNLPDFRAGERTFQLISQAIGRAGRGQRRGEVLIQTHHPGHYAIELGARQDFSSFYREELLFRESLGYPPFAHLIKILCQDKAETRAKTRAEALAADLWASGIQGLEVLGPLRGTPYRLRGQYRWQLVLKTKDLDKTNRTLGEMMREPKHKSEIRIDVDPQSLGF